jgi:hypothetical protein
MRADARLRYAACPRCRQGCAHRRTHVPRGVVVTPRSEGRLHPERARRSGAAHAVDPLRSTVRFRRHDPHRRDLAAAHRGSMDVELVSASAPAWNALLGAVPHDIYHLPGHVEMSAAEEAAQERAEAHTIIARDGDRAMLLPTSWLAYRGMKRRAMRFLPTGVPDRSFGVSTTWTSSNVRDWR